MPKQRDHIPALSGRRLRTALKAIDRLPLNKQAKAGIQNLLIEAATPDRHDPEHAAGRQHGANIKATETTLTGLSRAHMANVTHQLAGAMDDEAWMDQREQDDGTA